MSGKPAARQTDTVTCPRCGGTAIATGSPNVFFDGLPAARVTDCTTCGSIMTMNEMSSVQINGLSSLVIGSQGSHGDTITSGSPTIIIGDSFAPAPMSPVSPMPEHLVTKAPAVVGLAPGSIVESVPSVSETDRSGLEEEEEEEELENVLCNITLRVGVFFDGTGNNRANSESVYGCFAKDLGLEDAGEDIREFCATHGYDGAGSAPDDSYGNDTSNVAKLFDLYKDDSPRRLESSDVEAAIRVYVEGIGTSSGTGDSLYGQGTGLGDTGVRARVEQSPALLITALRSFQLNNPDRRIEQIQFDVFGFSRGAAAARDFANEVLKGEQSILATAIPRGTPGMADTFAWKPQQDVSINFIGLYDTVAAISDPFEGDFTGHDAINPGINLYLAPGIAKKVVHLVARDERRYNFSSNSAGSSDLRLPGVHSDLGGGYRPKAIERVLLSKPRSCEVSIGDSPETTSSYKLATFDLDRVQRQLARYDLSLIIRIWAVRFIHRAKGDVVEGKRVYAAVSSQREVRSDLALIYLRIMRQLAVQNDVPFDDIDEQEARTALPGELLPIADKLTAYALGQSKVIGLSASEEELLYHRYVHLSANWNAAKGLNNSEWDAVFINRPNLGLERTVHPNE